MMKYLCYTVEQVTFKLCISQTVTITPGSKLQRKSIDTSHLYPTDMMKKRLNCVLEFCSPLVVVYLVSCPVWCSISSRRTCVTELHISSNNNLLLDWLWYSKEKTTFRVCFNAEIFHNPNCIF